MNLREHFTKIALFLEEFSFLHEKEFLSDYPKAAPVKIQKWLDEIRSWNDTKIALMETAPERLKVVDVNFQKFLDTVGELKNIPLLELDQVSLTPELSRKLNLKKKHEIQQISSFVNSQVEQTQFVDIGSGAGHLSNALVFKSDKSSLCIDMDDKLQIIGKDKIKYWLPENANSIKFKKLLFTDHSKLVGIDSTKSMLIGLHGCGPLSTSIVKNFHFESYASLLSFGCCYHKLADEFNISKLSEQFHAGLSKQSFFLAERTTSNVVALDVSRRREVKKFRYGLHFFLNDKFDLSFSSVGNAKKSDYKGEFAFYAKKYHVGDELRDFSNEELNSYIGSEKFLSKFSENFALDSLRSLLGRVIEIYLILDRALFLEEKGHKIDVFQMFDSNLSPRNIAIFAKNELNSMQKL
jgi:hypothetical protein